VFAGSGKVRVFSSVNPVDPKGVTFSYSVVNPFAFRLGQRGLE